jgi:hypothetical protein
VSTRRCPLCGAQYIATATMCADCHVVLVDDPVEDGAPPAASGGPLGEGDHGDETDVEEVVFDLADWDADLRVLLDRTLDAQRIPRLWDGGDLIVPPPFEDRVTDLIEEIDFPDALDPDEDDDGDDAAPELMSVLYVGADRLVANPAHPVAIVEVLEAVERIAGVGSPFGIEEATWEAIVEWAEELADALGQDAEDEVISATARQLRDRLRPYV